MAIGVALALASSRGNAQRVPTERRTAELVLSIGGDAGGAAGRAGSGTILDVQVMADGHIVALDGRTGRVRVYTPAGEQRTEFGGVGRRAGQFGRPNALAVTDSTILVHDALERRWLEFTLQGRQRRTRAGVPAGAEREYPMRHGAVLIERAPRLPLTSRDALPDSALDRVIGVRPRSRRAIEWLFRVRADVVLIRPPAGDSGRAARHATVVPAVSRFGDGGAWARSGDSVFAHANGYSGDVTWYRIDEGGVSVAARGHLARTGREISADDVADEANRLFRLRPASRAVSAAARQPEPDGPPAMLNVPPAWSVATRTLFAPDGSLWVGVNRIFRTAPVDGLAVQVAEENTWTVFHADGSTFTVTLRPLFQLMSIRGDRVYGVVDDGRRPPTIVAYAIPRA